MDLGSALAGLVVGAVAGATATWLLLAARRPAPSRETGGPASERAGAPAQLEIELEPTPPLPSREPSAPSAPAGASAAAPAAAPADPRLKQAMEASRDVLEELEGRYRRGGTSQEPRPNRGRGKPPGVG